MGVSYRALPDRSYGGGCQAVGSVQLLNIGVPVTNLTAVTCPLAAALADWSRVLRQLARESLGSDLARIESFGSYACRRSEEHTSELQSLMRISYAVFCLKKKKKQNPTPAA